MENELTYRVAPQVLLRNNGRYLTKTVSSSLRTQYLTKALKSIKMQLIVLRQIIRNINRVIISACRTLLNAILSLQD